MGKFIYKFESVKKVKETLEKKAQKELAVIELEIERQKEVRQKLILEIQKQKNSLRNVKAGEVKFQKGYEQFLLKRIETINQKIDKLKIEKEIRLSELVQKSKEHQIFEKLEEAHLAEFNGNMNRLELGQFDEFATQKFIRNK